MLHEALEYTKAGVSIIPVSSNKRPRLRSWSEFMQRSASVAEITSWFARDPDAGIGLICGKISNILVLDVEVYALWVLDQVHLPHTLTSETRSGGRHFYFAYDAKIPTTTWSRDGQHLGEVRSDGNYVVAPPSAGYRWLTDPRTTEPKEAPEWLGHIRGRAQVSSRPRRSSLRTQPCATNHHASRSEEDQAITLDLLMRGIDDDSIGAQLRERASVQERGRHADEYIARGIRRARDFAVEVFHRAKARRIQRTEHGIAIDFEVLSGRHAKRVLRRAVRAPLTPNDRFWSSASALMSSVRDAPHQMLGREFAILIREHSKGLSVVGSIYSAEALRSLGDATVCRSLSSSWSTHRHG